MTSTPKPVWHFVLMMIWYGVLLIGSAGLALLGLAFGSEAYRNKPIPIAELAIVAGPLIVTAVLFGATIYCWNTDRQKAAYQLCGVSVIGVFAVFRILGGVASI